MHIEELCGMFGGCESVTVNVLNDDGVVERTAFDGKGYQFNEWLFMKQRNYRVDGIGSDYPSGIVLYVVANVD